MRHNFEAVADLTWAFASRCSGLLVTVAVVWRDNGRGSKLSAFVCVRIISDTGPVFHDRRRNVLPDYKTCRIPFMGNKGGRYRKLIRHRRAGYTHQNIYNICNVCTRVRGRGTCPLQKAFRFLGAPANLLARNDQLQRLFPSLPDHCCVGAVWLFFRIVIRAYDVSGLYCFVDHLLGYRASHDKCWESRFPQLRLAPLIMQTMPI